MKMIKKTVVLMSLISLLGCGQVSTESVSSPESAGVSSWEYGDNNAQLDSREMTESELSNNDHDSEHSDEQTNEVKRKLIKNAVLCFETDSLLLRKELIDRAVSKFGGYIANEENYSSYNKESVDVTIRVPNENFDAFMSMATYGVGEFDSRAISVNDVTEEYVDVAARIETKKELKKRFVSLLDRAESIKKMIEIEHEISALQEEIESFESRLMKMSSLIAFSTITITYYKELPKEEVVEENQFVLGLERGWDMVVLFLVALTNLWPFIVFGSVVLILYRRRIQRKHAVRVK